MKKAKSDEIIELLRGNPVIAAVKDGAGLAACLNSQARVVFCLWGAVVDIAGITERIDAAGKRPVVHIDLIDGLAARDAAVDFVARNTRAAGIISTKPALVRHARELGLCAVRRYFLLDSLALTSMEKQMGGDADMVEVLPGAMPKILKKVAAIMPLPLIAGGLIADKEDVMNALSAGALAVSSTNPAVWNL